MRVNVYAAPAHSLQDPKKGLQNIFKKDPGSAKQKSQGTVGTNFTKPRKSHFSASLHATRLEAPGWLRCFSRVAAFIQAGGDLCEVGLQQPFQIAKIKIIPSFLIIYSHC